MELLLLLLAAHFLGDFYLQAGDWIKCRNDNHIRSIGLWKHFSVHLILYVLVFLLLSYSVPEAVISIAILSISHLLTDCWKSYQKSTVTYFLIDQCIHLVIIVVVWLWLSNLEVGQIIVFLGGLITAKNLVIAVAYVLVGKPTSVLIAMALKRHTDSLKADYEDSTTVGSLTIADTKEQNDGVGLISAGAWIGYIERSLAISFLFTGHFAGIGFLVGTKTIFRFGDLTKNHHMKLTEYIMLGTLLSYAIALFVGWGALHIYSAL